MPVKNRFNNIDSKEWLPFQKSWFVFENDEKLYRSNIRFFTQKNEETPLPNVFYKGEKAELFKRQCELEERSLKLESDSKNLMFALVDLRGKFKDLDAYLQNKQAIINECLNLYQGLMHRKFLCVLIENIEGDSYAPIAWDFAQSLKSYYSLKDEKIGGNKPGEKLEGNHALYALYFRKDEKSQEIKPRLNYKYNAQPSGNLRKNLGAWQVIRPPRRNKNEILHPAKYPETLIGQFVSHFSKKGDNIFDPMSGTGSSQLAALQMGRNAYGTELSPFFHKIAVERCSGDLFLTDSVCRIELEDAKNVASLNFPEIDYLITSPPYWDMLNMKGAEYQARRKEKGLQLNYSDHESDLGNVEDYNQFLDDLVEVYKQCNKIMKKGAHATIIVKNIKKKGSNYPFAWDLSEKLCEMGWKLLPEFFWCQDDINLAPYGYGNTWVSNTFHQYCLNFKKV
ncbi:MAG: site-specific DNA-methyltransferase [Bacteroidia bacterium]